MPLTSVEDDEEKKYFRWRNYTITAMGSWGAVYLIIAFMVIEIGAGSGSAGRLYQAYGWIPLYLGAAVIPVGIICLRIANSIVRKTANFSKAINLLRIPLYLIAPAGLAAIILEMMNV